MVDILQPDHAYGYPREDEWPEKTDEKAKHILNGGAYIVGASKTPHHVILEIPSYGLKEVHEKRIHGLGQTTLFAGQAIKLPYGGWDRFVIAATEHFHVAEPGLPTQLEISDLA